MEIILDGLKIHNKQELFIELKKQINHDEFYGNNLDALYDILTSIKQEVIITIHHEELLENHLKKYYQSLLDVFFDCENVKMKHTI